MQFTRYKPLSARKKRRRARRLGKLAQSYGLELRRSIPIDTTVDDFGGWMLMIPYVHGVYRGQFYELDLDDVEEILALGIEPVRIAESVHMDTYADENGWVPPNPLPVWASELVQPEDN